LNRPISKQQGDPCHTLALLTRGHAKGGMLAGRTDLDALTVARRLLTIERQPAQIVKTARRC